jgi:hypothetical protein
LNFPFDDLAIYLMGRQPDVDIPKERRRSEAGWHDALNSALRGLGNINEATPVDG